MASESDGGKEVEEGSVDDVGAEYMENGYAASAEEETVLYQRLYKKRSNMALALYHKNHPDEQYQFLRVRLNDIFNFMEYRLQHPFNTHMNFMALDVNTGLEKLFFAELCMSNDCNDGNSGYVAVTCEIVDDNSASGRKDKGFFPEGKYPPDYYDGENCYACSERIKHPPGASYRAGHDVFEYGYGVEEKSID
ncbi:hypothetical protein EJB05_32190 [Eragrostis curvula]|uniref:DUF3615 domain-containing protein n=1 Tax=Eragrostis curvula TaxID=38414 RepID=A0A5J9UGW5_9POAL|nr:hypothetical protein EJB05_32190 [Eragrostis curvula]